MNLAESATWDAGIYQIETEDLVQGGEGGVSNLQPKQLANRTQYLKQQLELKAAADHDHAGAYAALDHDHDGVYATPADLAALIPTGSLTGSGYQIFPGGLIIQWGGSVGSGGTAEFTITFPIAFPNDCLMVIASAGYTEGEGTTQLDDAIIGIARRPGYTQTQAVVGSRRPTQGIKWFAVGH
jgi:hypothetical protein